MVKLILGIAGGLVAAILLVLASDALFHALIPSAADGPRDPGDDRAMADYVARQPVGVLAVLVAGWAIAALAGSAIAARVAGRGEWPGWLVGAIVLLATASNFALIPHPGWMVALAIVSIVAAAWLGARAGVRPSVRSRLNR